MTTWRPALAGLAILVGLLSASGANAHFNLNLNVRIFHVEHLETGLRIFLRTPMPYLVADRVGPIGEDGLPAAAPFTTNRHQADRVVHFVDWPAIGADPTGLGRIAAQGLRIETEGRRLDATVVALRAYPIGAEPGFATLEEATAALADGPAVPRDPPETYVGDTLVDAILQVQTGAPVYDYALSSLLDPGLPGQAATANLILDHAPGGTNTYRASGLLHQPVLISSSPLAAARTFVLEGIRHILEGLDHVLFVICLVLGATTFRRLVGRVTGFTIGHTVTLSLGFFGYVPTAAWFIPAVELGIALSILYAAAIAFLGPRSGVRESQVILVTAAIGLLHGLGFSFVLHEILRGRLAERLAEPARVQSRRGDRPDRDRPGPLAKHAVLPQHERERLALGSPRDRSPCRPDRDHLGRRASAVGRRPGLITYGGGTEGGRSMPVKRTLVLATTAVGMRE